MSTGGWAGCCVPSMPGGPYRPSARAAAALRLLMLTGCRLNEILTLRWDDVDRKAGELRLRDAKTGRAHGAFDPHRDKRSGRD